jgi:hypothetical protein
MTETPELDFSKIVAGEAQALGIIPTLNRFPTGAIKQLINNDAFRGDPVVLPIPAEASPEIPRVILQDPETGLRLQVSGERVILAKQTINQELGINVGEFLSLAPKILEDAMSALNSRPNRLAALASMYLRHESPASALSRYFCQSDSFGNTFSELKDFELHAMRRLALLEGLTVNSWTRFKVGLASQQNSTFSVILVERDVNTLTEETERRAFSSEEMKAFFSSAGKALIDELKEYERHS